MNQLRETCHCGHDKASHYRDLGAASREHTNCLCMGCSCPRYVNEFDPKPKKRFERPAGHPFGCSCFYCRRAAADRETDPPPAGDSGVA